MTQPLWHCPVAMQLPQGNLGTEPSSPTSYLAMDP